MIHFTPEGGGKKQKEETVMNLYGTYYRFIMKPLWVEERKKKRKKTKKNTWRNYTS